MDNKRTLIDFMCIAVVYILYGTCIYLATEFNLPGELGVTPAPIDGRPPDGKEFRDAFYSWSFVVMGVSLVMTIVWYVLGEWGLKAHRTSSGTWILIWLILMGVILGAAFAAVMLGPQASENAHIPALFYFMGGVGFYILATVLFSPVDTKYIVWPSKLIRRW